VGSGSARPAEGPTVQVRPVRIVSEGANGVASASRRLTSRRLTFRRLGSRRLTFKRLGADFAAAVAPSSRFATAVDADFRGNDRITARCCLDPIVGFEPPTRDKKRVATTR
jgi:hypothetical protein